MGDALVAVRIWLPECTDREYETRRELVFDAHTGATRAPMAGADAIAEKFMMFVWFSRERYL
ncbi:hypothetical protein N9L76_06715 [bacterium]|jgi:hypothetical protein|nr:hypothetical protein [bacterium]|tara:strand:- start:9599 stop:9784 length:186 start_codon:yes stop_codon:yes gene_type:complete